MVNPLAFVLLDWLRSHGTRKHGGTPSHASDSAESPTPLPNAPAEQLAGHSIIVGYGRVGSIIGEALIAGGEPMVVIEENPAIAEDLRRKDIQVVEGPDSPETLLTAANVGRAHRLFLAIPNAFEAGQYTEIALAANEEIVIVGRAHSDAEAEHLKGLGAHEVVMGEREIGLAMAARAITGAAGAGS